MKYTGPTRRGRAFLWSILPLVLFAGVRLWALPDSLSLTVTNTWTKQPVVFSLQRYNLRATNYQVRVYTDATNFTTLPGAQIPEVTTYRGRIPSDTGAYVCGAFGPDGRFYYNVSYGCRWQESTSEYDPYDTTNRLSWGGWGASVATTNVPSLGYTYVYQTNMPQHLTWSTSNYPTNPASSYGGPPWLNTFQQVPAQRARIIQEMDQSVFVGTCGGSNSYAILMQESRINEMDYIMARDYGVCYQVVCICLRPYTNAPFTASGNSRLPQLSAYWGNDPGYSHGYFTNGFFDMAQASLYEGGGVAYAPGDWALTDPGFNGNVQGHENGHNWGAADYVTGWDYTGDNRWHCSHTGSGYAYGTDEAMAAMNLRRTSWKANYEWVKYNSTLAPHATPDFATTRTNLPVSLNVLLNDYVCNSNTLTVASFETNTPAGGVVTNLGNGFLQYTPPADFVGYDLFHYYVAEPSGLKSLTGVKVLVTNAAAPLLAQWMFDQTNGTVVTEATGNAPSGTLYGSASFSSGSVPGIGSGRALHFDGSGYARFKGTWFDPLNGSISLSLWCKPDAIPTGTQMLFMKCDNDWNRESGLKVGLTAASFFVTGSTFGSTFGGFGATANIVPQPGVWYHLVAEIDRASNLVRLFVNGVEYTTTSNTRSIPAGEFIFGENWPIIGAANSTHGWGSYYVGTVDDLRLYTKALTAQEVTALYQGGGILPAAGPGPVNGEGNVVFQPTLTWQPGGTTNFAFNVFLGTNAASVMAATTNSAEYKGQVSSARFTVSSPLTGGATYYWRVDELYGPGITLASDVWSFTTAVDAIHGGLRLYLSFDSRDTVGTTTYDRSVRPYHDGTLYGSPTQAVGQVYESLGFNGSSTYVQSSALNMATSNATFLAWVKLSGNQSAYDGIVMCRGGSTWSGMMIASTPNRLGYQWNDDYSTWTYNSGPTLPINEWVLAVVSVTNNRALFYVGQTNGVLTITTNTYTHIYQAFDAPTYVGQDPFGGRWFNGLIDEVCIWNRSLSTAEVGAILTNGINGLSFSGGRPVATPGTFTWTGNSDTYWTNTLNWATNATPVASSTVYFNDAANQTSTQLGTNCSVAGINISGGIRGVGISGSNMLAIGTGGIQMTNTAAGLTLGATVSLAAGQTWTVADGGMISVPGTLTNSGYLLTLNDTNAINLTGLVSGTGGLTHNGPGTLTLTTANSYSGPNIVNGGKLVSTVSCWYSPRGIGSGTLTINSGATAQFTATHGFGVGTGGQSATVNGGTLQFDKENYVSGLTMTAGSLIGTGELRTSGNVTYNFNAAAASSLISLGLNLVYGSLTFSVANGAADPDLMVSGSIYGTGGNVTKTGAGSLMLTRACTYSGNMAISQGTLKLSGSDDLLPIGSALSVAGGATLTLDNINQTVGSLSGSGTINLGSGSFSDTTVSNDVFSGVITGAPNGAGVTDYQRAPSGGLGKDGTGKLTLSATQSYNGDTWVLGGTLALTGSGSLSHSTNLLLYSGAALDVTARSDGTLNLVSGQTLLGYGTVLGKVAVASGATIAPGDNVPGTLTTGAETWYGGGIYAWGIGDPVNASGRDLLNISATLNVQATTGNKFVLKLLSLTPTFTAGALNGFNNQSNYQWTVATTTAGLLNFNPAAFVVDTAGFSNSLAGGIFSLSQSGNALVLAFTPAAAPVISNQPASQTIYVGSNATFSVTAGGTPAPAYQWQFNGTNIANATASSYAVLNAQPLNEGAYKVVLTNTVSALTSSPASLSLYREFASAPAPYPSLLASNGARHLIVPGYRLGATNVASTDARTNSLGNDGVSFLTALRPGQGASIQVVVTESGYLSGWIDYATNGSWAGALDQALTNVAVVTATNVLSFTVPAGAVVTPATWARFRFSTATNLSFTGEAPNGEVEDYPVAILSNPPPTFTGIALLPDSTLALSGIGAVSQTYILLAASNLVPPIDWTRIATNVADSGGVFTLDDSQATNHIQRFYRVLAH